MSGGRRGPARLTLTTEQRLGPEWDPSNRTRPPCRCGCAGDPLAHARRAAGNPTARLFICWANPAAHCYGHVMAVPAGTDPAAAMASHHARPPHFGGRR